MKVVSLFILSVIVLLSAILFVSCGGGGINIPSLFVEWKKTLGGSYGDGAESIQQTDDGGYIVAGYTCSNDGDVDGNHGYCDFWVVKLDENGAIQWQKCLGGSSNDQAYSIQQTKNGGYIVAGWTWSNDGNVSGYHGYTDFWVVKLDPNGNIEWQKCLGGSYDDRAYSIQQTSDGGYIVAGWTWSNDGNVSGNHGNADFWVVKLNEYGTIQWQKCLGGRYLDLAYSIQQTSDGGYIVVGETRSNDGDVSGWHEGYDENGYTADMWIVKLDRDGNIQWQKCLGGSGNDQAYSIQQTSDGGYIVVGETRSNDGDVSGWHGGYDENGDPKPDMWIVKLDSNGNIQWQKCLGGSDYDVAESVQRTSDGGYIVAGWTSSNNGDVSGNHGVSDFWIIKLK